MRDFVSINIIAQLILQTACLIWICWKNETRYDPLLSVITILLGVYSGNKAVLAWMNVNTFVGIWCALFIAQLIGGMALTIIVNEFDVLIKHLLKRELMIIEEHKRPERCKSKFKEGLGTGSCKLLNFNNSRDVM